MEKLDLKDRKILYQLDIDSRQSFRSIGRKVGLSKDVVASRVKKLQDSGVIKHFYTQVDSFKLGYICFRFYIVYRDAPKEIQDEIIDYFIKDKHITILASLKGEYDLIVGIYVKEMNEFFYLWRRTLNKYRDYFQQQIFSTYNQQYAYRASYLFEDDMEKTDRNKYEIITSGSIVKTDSLDFKILKILTSNARIPTKDIAKKLNSTTKTIADRIKKLTKMGVIQAYRVNIDHSLLDYYLYKANITLNKYNIRGDMIRYIKKNHHLILIDETAGFADLELDFIVDSARQFHCIIDDLSTRFPNSIKNYNYFFLEEYLKFSYFPEE